MRRAGYRGERFVVIENLGFAHLECVVGEPIKKYQSISREALFLLEVDEALTYSIVRLKTVEIETESDHLRGLIAAARRDLEKHSAFLGNELGKLLGYLWITYNNMK